MFESFEQKAPKSSMRWTFWAGTLIVAGIIGLAIVVPTLWPAEIPKEALSRGPLYSPAMTGNPNPPHVKVVDVKRESGPRSPKRPFLPPVFTEPRHVPVLPPLDDIGGGPGLPNAPEVTGSGPYCPNCIPGPPCVGCVGNDPRFTTPPLPPPPPVVAKETPKPFEPPKQVVVGGKVQEAKLIRRVMPAYSPLAKQAGVSGLVRLSAVIAEDGTIQSLRAVSGHPLLVPAAMEAVRQWVYSPTLLNERAVQVVTQIDVNFVLSR